MPVPAGTRLGGYDVIGLIGAGGMGEVYRARDSRLNRDVALKILPELFAADPERLARFEREAQALAALNHPHIAQIYGAVDDVIPDRAGLAGQTGPAVRALVMELVEGDTLAERIASGPLDVEDALAIARQVADALDVAHDHGIIHRDLKPANIKVRQDGAVKVLDFGLAKLESASDPASVMGATLSPTISVAFTGAGVILGTAAYMAPEQARGRMVDKRVDIWAFGCILFEMLTASKAFDGTDATEMIAAVVRGEPEWSALPAATPPSIRALLRHCLQKDPKQRLRDIGDARAALTAISEPEAAVAPVIPAKSRRLSWARVTAAAATILVVAAAAGYGARRLNPDPPRRVARFAIALPPDQQLTFAGRHMIAISPTSEIAYSANNGLFLRHLDQLDAVPVRGTFGSTSTGARSPFFSPDGQWLGFWADNALKKVSVSGGAPIVLCAADNPWGAHWEGDNTILFGQGPRGIMRVSGSGGMPETIITVKDAEAAQSPQLLPDGRTVLFTVATRATGAWNEASIVVQSLDTGARKVVIRGGTDARYLESGYIVYGLNGTLLAVPFDAKRLEVTGGAVSLVEDVGEAAAGITGALHYGVSPDGTLVYVPSSYAATESRTFSWMDRNGNEEPTRAPIRFYRYVRMSPDGQRLALDALDGERDIWIWSLKGETLTRLTLDAAQEQYGIWTPDGLRVIFASSAGGVPNLYWQSADGTGAIERLTTSPQAQFPQTVTPDGTQLIFRQVATGGGSDLMVMSLTGDRTPKPLVATPFNEVNAELSADGKWLAYESPESGKAEVYVRPFPDVGDGHWQLSTEGGSRPLWSRDGKELFYVSADGSLMSVPVHAVPAFAYGKPERLFNLPPLNTGIGRHYDVSPDGKRFVVVKASRTETRSVPPSITFVQNWVEEVKRRVVSR